MIEKEDAYKSYLRKVRNLTEGTVNSYPTYLAAITNHLGIDITSETVRSSDSVSAILNSLKSSLIDKNYWGNCQSALRAYLDFLNHEKMHSSTLNENELKLLNYLVAHFQRGDINPGEPRTHLPYSHVLRDLDFPNDGGTPGDSLNKHAMGGLAEWLSNNELPAITGIIVNMMSDKERPGIPSKSYFQYHQKEDMDFNWQRSEITLACNLDWIHELTKLGVVLDGDFSFPEEVPATLKEGAKKTVVVNSYERNSTARNKCINVYGVICNVCNFNFEKQYGSRGQGFIHVHHITPVSEIGDEYEIDPVRDLRPVCPNYHAMLHRKGSISIEELKQEISFIKALKQTSR